MGDHLGHPGPAHPLERLRDECRACPAQAALAGWLQGDGFVGQYDHGTNRSLTIEFMTVTAAEREWVLEHIDLNAIQRLFLSTPEGYTLALDPAPYDKTHETGFLRIFAEIAPLRMLVMSRLDFPAFGKYITDPAFPKGAPKQFYTQIELDIEHFLEEFEGRPTMHAPIPGLHPSNLRAAIMELRADPQKQSKGLRLDSAFETIPYKLIRHGFMFASQDETRFFPMPTPAEIEATNYRFWRAM